MQVKTSDKPNEKSRALLGQLSDMDLRLLKVF